VTDAEVDGGSEGVIDGDRLLVPEAVLDSLALALPVVDCDEEDVSLLEALGDGESEGDADTDADTDADKEALLEAVKLRDALRVADSEADPEVDGDTDDEVLRLSLVDPETVLLMEAADTACGSCAWRWGRCRSSTS
jgi:hypothetical protein